MTKIEIENGMKEEGIEYIDVAVDFSSYNDYDVVCDFVFMDFKDDIYRDLNIKNLPAFIDAVSNENLHSFKSIENSNNYLNGYIERKMKNMDAQTLLSFIRAEHDSNFMRDED